MSQQALKNGDWVALRQILMRLGPTSLPTYLALTASRLLGTNTTKQLESKDLNDFVGGTPNQVLVASDSVGGVILSGPQDINTDSSVIFGDVTAANLTANRLVSSDGSKKMVSSDLNNWVDGTDVNVADDGDGSVTLSMDETKLYFFVGF